MKTFPYLLAMSMAVSAAMTSCTEDEVVTADAGRPIEFHIDLTSRTDHYTTDNLEKITVIAIPEGSYQPEFIDVFIKDSESSTFKSTTPHYWGKSYEFFVLGGEFSETQAPFFMPKIEASWGMEYGDEYYLNILDSSVSECQPVFDYNEGTNGPKLYWVLASNAPDQRDLILATAKGSESDMDAGVALQFEHLLSKITFKAFEENADATVKLNTTILNNIKTSGVYDINTKKWIVTSDHGGYLNTQACDAKGSTAQTLTNEATEYLMDHFMVIPQNATAWDAENDHENTGKGTYLSYKLNVTVGGKQMIPYQTTEGKTRDTGYSPIGRNWEAGKQYVYTLDFTDGFGNTSPDDPEPAKPLLSPVQFTCSVVDWNQSAEPTINAGE